MTFPCPSVLFLLRARLHRLHGEDEAEDPAGAENVFEVVLPGALDLLQPPLLHLTPGLPTGHQQNLLAAEAGADQTNAEPHVQHQHQEELQARDRS